MRTVWRCGVREPIMLDIKDGVSFNIYKLSAFLHRVQQFLFKAMNRRGCRRTYTWNGFIDMLKYDPLAKPKVYYPLY